MTRPRHVPPNDATAAARATSAALAALARGAHAEPFTLLGPHPAGDGLVVRVLAPGASAVRLRLGGRAIPGVPLGDGGIFAATVAASPAPPIDAATGRLRYRLEITGPDGAVTVRDDPYRFGPLLEEDELARFAAGVHQRIGERLGAHLATHQGTRGVRFAVWAPEARRVSVVGEFNEWNGITHPMRSRGSAGLWELFVPGLVAGALYKYAILPPRGGAFLKTDPVGGFTELRPGTASIVIEDVRPPTPRRKAIQPAGIDGPISIYEVHPGSWRREADGRSAAGRWLTWNELADRLVPYAATMGFTHLELMPITEHPFDASWGYQTTGYFAPTSRFGTPVEFARFVAAARAAGLGILLDWVPAHFPRDAAGLRRFVGTALYEHADPRRGAHPDWGTLIFDWGRREVRDFLVSSALHWLDRYGVGGLRVDAVASMLYLDYSRRPGEWLPNQHGGHENLEAIDFIRHLNDVVHERHPGVITCAEESTAWPGVTRASHEGGLGFDLKWNMGWTHDTLGYFAENPVHRSFHHERLTAIQAYAFSERFLLPLSHDDVVHLKRALISKLPGDTWQRFANLRALYATQWTQPGKKLLFMGGEIAQWAEWNDATQLDWWLLDDPTMGVFHRGIQALVRDLNGLYRGRGALHEQDSAAGGFAWIEASDAASSVMAWRRMGRDPADALIIVANYTPVVRSGYRIGVPADGATGYREVLTSDARAYGGGDVRNADVLAVDSVPAHGQAQSIALTLPPLGVTILEPVRGSGEREGRSPRKRLTALKRR